MKEIKIKHTDVFFTSDLHLAHDKEFIWKSRGFSSSEDHFEGMIKNWNKTVSETSDVFILGDTAFKDGGGEKISRLINSVKFNNLYLMPGNHPSGYSHLYKKALKENFPKVHEMELNVFPLAAKINKRNIIFLPNYFEIRILAVDVILCHFPIISHNKMQRNSIHLCGHSHHSNKITNMIGGQGKRLDVGVDYFKKPISWKEVLTILKDRDIDSWDHHSAKLEE